MPLKEQTRLFLPTLAVSVLLLCLGGLAAWYLHRSQHESSRLLSRNVIRVQAGEELMLLGARKQVALYQFLLTGERHYLNPLSQFRRNADKWITRASDLASAERDRALVETLRAGHEHFGVELDELIQRPPSADERPAAVANLNGILEQEILEPARQYQRFNRERLAELTSRNQSLSDRMGLVLTLLGISGALAGLLAGFTVARAAQRRLLESQQAMARSEQLATLGRVAAAVAHELRNPLTSMRIIAQSASTNDNQVSLDATDFEILEHEIERLDDSIQTFLDYARPPRPEKRTCIVQSLVRQTVSLVERRAAQTGIEIRTELPAEPIEVEADPGQLKQVLLNILINALDASPSGGAVTLRSRITTFGNGRATDAKMGQGRELVEIEIADAGTGLPDDLGDRIFDAFVSTKETGTGLGLAICKRIIEEHGGEIDAHNAPDVGAVVSVRLPAFTNEPRTSAVAH